MTDAADVRLNDFHSLFSLKGEVAVVTGGSRGLGLNAASAFLQAGAAKVFVSSRKSSACSTACAALNALPNLRTGAVAIPVPADLSTIDGVQHLVRVVSSHTPRVDILLANAGATWGASFDEHSDSAIAKVLDLNVRAVFNTIRLFTPLLERSGTADDPSRVMITASTSGLAVGILGQYGSFGYSASKAAAISLARNLGVELGPRHITVNAICPGFFPTRMSNGVLELTGGADLKAKLNPTGRLGRPEDMAGAVVYLASRAGAYVNGEALVIDGGAVWVKGGYNATDKL